MADRRSPFRSPGLLARLRAETAGNTLALIAAGLFPLLALVGGGIDMGRSYLSQSRLQQACDAGVLAARKRLGSQAVLDGEVPDDVADIGQRFFDLNFQDGAYSTTGRDFHMTLEPDYAISGDAVVDVPTTIMTLFGYSDVPVEVTCQARLNFSNTDIMFVLDTTGSMADTNPSDSLPRIDILRTVVESFHDQIEGSKGPGTRVRYGFVPYSTNVNVGGLLHDDWMVGNWHYQSREQVAVGSTPGTNTHDEGWNKTAGTLNDNLRQSASDYNATWHDPVTTTTAASTTIDANENVVTTPGGTVTEPGFYTCDADPADTVTGPPDDVGTPADNPLVPGGTITHYTRVRTGRDYKSVLNGDKCEVFYDLYANYTEEWDRHIDPTTDTDFDWHYAMLNRDVSNWRSETNSCIEERGTYEIDDYNNVDFDQALDLDIDKVPTADDATKWRPMYPNEVFARSMLWDNTGSFTTADATTDDEYIRPAWAGLASCPAAARNLAEMTSAEVTSYLATLNPTGATYHDIGMIWGGRLLSPNGLFAAENADVDGKPTQRHMIFLTDGLTAPLDLAYGAYGLEPLDQRRWKQSSAMSLQETVEARFAVACQQVRNRNITVWVIGFGVGLNPALSECAGPGHSFEAADAGELNDVFTNIAQQLGDLRISK